jgi:nucleoside-diphosphate-sugar epimerase
MQEAGSVRVELPTDLLVEGREHSVGIHTRQPTRSPSLGQPHFTDVPDQHRGTGAGGRDNRPERKPETAPDAGNRRSFRSIVPVLVTQQPGDPGPARNSIGAMRIVVIGGTGHIGTFLVPQLVALGHDVTVLSRGGRSPYRPHGAWSRVDMMGVDREAEDARGAFGDLVAGLDPEVVVDLVCFTKESARQLTEALEGRVQHLLHCGSIWVHGASASVPTREDAPRRPLGEYGVGKAAIERYLLGRARNGGIPATVIHPGHITGPGWVPVNPAGNLDLTVFQDLADGRRVALPNLGMETLQHVHAADVAGVFVEVIAQRSVSVGESFHAVGRGALTLRGYAASVAGWFGREADLAFLPWEQWRETVPEETARITWDHLTHSPHCSMDKATRLLGFRPRYSPLEATAEAVEALLEDGRLSRPDQSPTADVRRTA